MRNRRCYLCGEREPGRAMKVQRKLPNGSDKTVEVLKYVGERHNPNIITGELREQEQHHDE